MHRDGDWQGDVGRLITDGALDVVPGAPRVYRLAGAPGDPDRDPVRARWLQLGAAAEPMTRLRTHDLLRRLKPRNHAFEVCGWIDCAKVNFSQETV